MPDKSKKNIFIFVVCGKALHINTLNFSINYLKHFTTNEIIVVTDLLRNNVSIEHSNILDIKTPEEFEHHQASIFLKTQLHKILPPGNNYCYLDSDVIAISEKVNQIFEYITEPIIFASDHCRLNHFSPYAINCGCYDEKTEKQKLFKDYYEKYNSDYSALYQNQPTRELLAELREIKREPLRHFQVILKYLTVKYLPGLRYFHLNNKYYLDIKEKAWFDEQNKLLIYDFARNYKDIEKATGLSYSKLRKKWLDNNGKDIFDIKCNHLQQEIYNKFNIHVKDSGWQHWNGGVFLFNEKSHDFMDAWHSMTMEIFKDARWKTRDQGTLVATAWKFGLQKHQRLPKKFNFIADYYNPGVVHDKNKGYSDDNFKTCIKPAFIHVYHEFGRKDWDIWNSIVEINTGVHKLLS